jgi:hypothetical protein
MPLAHAITEPLSSGMAHTAFLQGRGRRIGCQPMSLRGERGIDGLAPSRMHQKLPPGTSWSLNIAKVSKANFPPPQYSRNSGN